jgi:hypothetical protein
VRASPAAVAVVEVLAPAERAGPKLVLPGRAQASALVRVQVPARVQRAAWSVRGRPGPAAQQVLALA